MVSSLQNMYQQRQQWLSEKPSGGNEDELRLNRDDLALLQFVANGDEGDRFIKVYRSHIVETTTKNGKTIGLPRYCPVQSADDKTQECPYCTQGHSVIKERMSIWFKVMNVLHTNLPASREGQPPVAFPQVNFEGRLYFNEEVNGFKIWHTSAWRESPLDDILNNANIYKGLHNFTARVIVVGDGINRRYKLYAMPQSEGISKEDYIKAEETLTPIPDLLRAAMAGPTQAAPIQTQPSGLATPQQPAPTITPFSVPGAVAPAFTPNTTIATDINNPTESVNTGEEASEEEIDARRPLRKLF